MLAIALNIGFASFGLALLLAAVRLWLGPDMVDRLLALDTMYTNALGLTLLLTIRGIIEGFDGRSLYFELALLIGLMGFVGTVGGARFLARGDAVE